MFIFADSNNNTMASVREVYTTLQGLANKDERGFVTPAVFNQFAATAQQKVFNNIFMELERATAQRLRVLDPGLSESRVRGLKQDLSRFVTRVQLDEAPDTTYPRLKTSLSLPTNFNRIIEVNYEPAAAAITAPSASASVNASTNAEVIPVEVIEDANKLQAILSSTLSRPTKDFPACYIVGLTLELYPHDLVLNKDIASDNTADEIGVDLVYYKNPASLTTAGALDASMPKFGITLTNNKEVYNASNSRDFELPDHYVMDLVIEMAKLIGVNLKDKEVYQHGAQEDVKEQRV